MCVRAGLVRPVPCPHATGTTRVVRVVELWVWVRARRRRAAGRLGRRRHQGRAAGRRPDAPALPAARRATASPRCRRSSSTTGASGRSCSTCRPEGRDRHAPAVATADVFVTNLRPDAVERLGLGPDELLAGGSRGSSTHDHRLRPRGSRRATGPATTSARSGPGPAWPRSWPPTTSPRRPSERAWATTSPACTTVAGILAALLERERTGRGQLVETSLLRTGIYCVGWDLGIQLRFGKLGSTGRAPPR